MENNDYKKELEKLLNDVLVNYNLAKTRFSFFPDTCSSKNCAYSQMFAYRDVIDALEIILKK